MENTVINTPDNGGEEEKNKIILRGIKKSQKDKLLTAGISGIVGILGGVGVMSAFSFVNKNDITEPDTIVEPIDGTDPIISEPVVIYTEAPFATTVDDSMSFGESFSAARNELGQGGFFEWKGNTYNTYYKEEWDSLSESEQNDFFDSVDQNATEIVVDTGADVNNDADTVTPVETIELNQDGKIDNAEADVNTNTGIYVIDEEDYIEAAELNQDGTVDNAEADVNNDTVTPDIIIDVDDDYSMDQIMLDDIFEADTTDNEIPIDVNQDASDAENVIPNVTNVEDNDVTPDNDSNPDIDNDVDMSDYS